MIMVLSLSLTSYASESSDTMIGEKNEAFEEAIKQFEEKRPSNQATFEQLKGRKQLLGDARIVKNYEINSMTGLEAETYKYTEAILVTEDFELVASISACKISQIPIKTKNVPSASIQGGSLRENDWDDSISVYAEVICYYDTKKAYDGAKMYNLYAVSVSNVVDDKSVSIYLQELIYGASAISEHGYAVTQSAKKYPSGSYNYYNTGFQTFVRDWAGNLGATYVLTLQRRSSYKWEFEIQCMVF